jgi:hypothetical protein
MGTDNDGTSLCGALAALHAGPSALDDVEVPEGTSKGKGLRHEVCGVVLDVLEGRGNGAWKGVMMDVAADVKIGIIEPFGVVAGVPSIGYLAEARVDGGECAQIFEDQGHLLRLFEGKGVNDVLGVTGALHEEEEGVISAHRLEFPWGRGEGCKKHLPVMGHGRWTKNGSTGNASQRGRKAMQEHIDDEMGVDRGKKWVVEMMPSRGIWIEVCIYVGWWVISPGKVGILLSAIRK